MDNYYIDYKDGYYISIISIDGYPKYFIIVGDDVPRFRHEIPANSWIKVSSLKYYIEFQTHIYGWNENNMVLLKKEYFDINGKNVLFNMNPSNINDLDIWINYIEDFCKLKNCKPLYKINDFIFDKNKYNINYYTDQDYYTSYPISWVDDLSINPKGIDMNSYELINNVFNHENNWI